MKNQDVTLLLDIDGWKWKARLAHTNGVSSPVLVLFAAVLKSYSATAQRIALHQATEARESQRWPLETGIYPNSHVQGG